MSDSRPGDALPSGGGTPPTREPADVPPPPPAPPGAGANDPWSPGPPQPRPPDGYGPPGDAYPAAYGSGYGAPAPAPQNGAGTAALVLGIVGLLFSVLFFPLGFVLAVIGLVLGVVGLKRARRGLATNRGAAMAGTVLSVLALVVCIGWGVVIGVLVNKTQDCNDPDLSRSEQRQCVEDRIGGFKQLTRATGSGVRDVAGQRVRTTTVLQILSAKVWRLSSHSGHR